MLEGNARLEPAGIAPGVVAHAKRIAALVFGVEGADLRSTGAAVGIMPDVAGVAAHLPACHASPADPIITLRYE